MSETNGTKDVNADDKVTFKPEEIIEILAKLLMASVQQSQAVRQLIAGDETGAQNSITEAFTHTDRVFNIFEEKVQEAERNGH